MFPVSSPLFVALGNLLYAKTLGTSLCHIGGSNMLDTMTKNSLIRGGHRVMYISGCYVDVISVMCMLVEV